MPRVSDERLCAECGTAFVLHPLARGQKFCREVCRGAFNARKRDPEKVRRYKAAWLASDRGKQYQRELAMKRHYAHPEKAAARRRVDVAVRSGRLSVPDLCQECGGPPTGKRRLHAHHHDYTKPLEVTWLCQRCHWAVHHAKN